jgi:hypothetical protein
MFIQYHYTLFLLNFIWHPPVKPFKAEEKEDNSKNK